MSKQSAVLAERAKSMYVKDQMTFNEIGHRLGVSERTVRNWRDKDGSWEREREAYVESRRSFHEDLYEFGRELMVSIRDDFRIGAKVDNSRLYCLGRILAYTVKPQDYETIKVSREGKNSKRSSQDITLSILSAMGMTGPDGISLDEDDGNGEL